jgi:tetratricopeptide (TPR) repeat protein
MTFDLKDDTPRSSLSILDQLRHLQETHEWDDAAALLAEHAPELLDRLNAAQLTAIFAPFPQRVIEQSPTVWYLAGLINARLQNIQSAMAWLMKAVTYLVAHELHPDRLVWCYLELARLHYAHDDFAEVGRYIDLASVLMERVHPLKPAHEPFFHYLVACLCADTGRVAEGQLFAERAARQYRSQHNDAREFRAWLAVVTFSHHTGDYQRAFDALERARRCYERGRLESTDYEALLNAETHLAWHRGQLVEALAMVEIWVRFSLGSGFHRQRLYAHWTMANILRAMERYDQALHYYELARAIAAEHTPNFIRWIDAQESWLALLQGDYAHAEAAIQRALTTADHGLTMSFQVNLAVIEAQTGRWQAAEERLKESLAFYQQSQDRLATCAITFHLAAVKVQQGARPATVVKLLRPELRWLEQCDNAYFPLWWHAEIVSRVAILLLGVPEFHGLARRFFRQPYLGEMGTRALQQAYVHATTSQQAELAELLAARGAAAPIGNSAPKYHEAKRVIAAAIESDLVEPAMIPLLIERLQSARRRNRNNSTAVAILLMHVQGVSTGDIAQRLAHSRSLVSHTLQMIYESFGVPRTEGSRIEQRSALMLAVRADGLLL